MGGIEMDYLTWDAWDSFGRKVEAALMSDAQAEGLFPRFDSVVLDDEQILAMLRGIESSCRQLMDDWNKLVQMEEVHAFGNSAKELNHAFRDVARGVSGCNFMVYAWLSAYKRVEP